jgi:ankyrin repeat protein
MNIAPKTAGPSPHVLLANDPQFLQFHDNRFSGTGQDATMTTTNEKRNPRVADPMLSAGSARLIASVFLLSALVASPPVGAADPLSESLQEGLVAEEVHHNLDAAIAAYRSVIARHDEQRRLVATALFRLGESYRKQGKTTEAIAQYQRLLAEFSDHTEIAQLSRTRLETLAPGTAIATGPLPPAIQRQKMLLEEELALVEQQISAMRNRIDGGRAASGDLIPLQREALTLQRQMVALEAQQPELLTVPAWIEDASAISDGVSEEEQREIERLEAVFRHSPDLINTQATLHSAARQGQLAVARFLIDKGADLEWPSGFSQTPLHHAVGNGHKAMTELLLAAGARVDPKDSQGETPLFKAVDRGFLEIAKVLLAAGADVNATLSSDQSTPLHRAVEQGRAAMIDLLLDAGADLEARISDRDTSTPLLYALRAGRSYDDPSIVEQLLARGADVNATSALGSTVLYIAVAERATPARSLLAILDRKPNLEARGAGNITPLQLACVNRNYNVARMLLKAGADPNVRFDQAGARPVFLVPRTETHVRGFKEPTSGTRVAGKLIQLEPEGSTPLHWAVADWDRELTELLLEHGADPNATDNNGHTPLLAAVESSTGEGSLDVNRTVIRLLLEAGADPNVSDRNGTSLLRHAIRVGSIELTAALLSRGVDPDHVDSTGSTPMHAAALWSHANAVELLVERGAAMDRQDHLGNTPLHVAAWYRKKDVVQFLLAHGAPVNLRNQRGETPLDLHRSSGPPNPEIVELLLEHGAEPGP